MWKKCWAWKWRRKLVFFAECNGGCCGFRHLQGWIKNEKDKIRNSSRYHEVVNNAIMNQWQQSFTEHTRNLEQTKRLKVGWRKRMMKLYFVIVYSDECSDEWLQSFEDTASFDLETVHLVSLSSQCSTHERGRISEGEKDESSTEACHDRAGNIKQRMAWKIITNGISQPGLRRSEFAMTSGKRSPLRWRQQSEQLWRRRQLQGTKVSEKVRREKPNCTKMVEVSVANERQEESFEKEGTKRMKQEIWLKEMQRNLEEAQNKSYEVERKLNHILWNTLKLSTKNEDAQNS